MRVWNEADHPRDWRGRFITTGVHVQVSGGLIGTVRGVRSGRLEGDPSEALVELPDGRVGTIPTDRLTVADPPNGYAWLGDGSMGGIGDIVVSDDGREVEIVDINLDGSITVAEENDFDNEEDVDPSSLSRGRQMATDDDNTPVEIAESNIPEPSDESPVADDLEPISEAAPGEDVNVSDLPEGLQGVYKMFRRASTLAEEDDDNYEAHEMVTIIGRHLLMDLELNNIEEDNPIHQSIQTQMDYHARRIDQIQTENAASDDGSDDGNWGDDGSASESAPGLSFLPEEKDPADYADWGERAETIAKNKGPKLDAFHAALASDNRSELRDAIHAAFNGENGLGKDGAYVKFSHVTRNQSDNSIKLSGKLYDKDKKVIGSIERSFIYDDPSDPEKITEVHNDYLSINPGAQGQGIARDLYRNQEDWLIREGIPKVTILANIDVGGYAWARAGYDYADYDDALTHVGTLYWRANKKYGEDHEITNKLRAIHQDLIDRQGTSEGTTFPTPFEMSRIGYEPGMTTWPGKKLMLGSSWNAVKYLVPPAKTGDEA